MTALRLSLTVTALALAPLTGAAAQDTLNAGDKVRVTTEVERVVGYWVSSDGKRLVFNAEQSGLQLALPLDSVSKLEVSRGQRSRAGKGALIGLAVGAGVGAGVGVLFGAGLGEDLCGDGCVGALAGIGALGGGAVGTLIGLGIGASSKTDRWEAVLLDRIRVSLTPIAPHGFGATLRLSFSP